MLEKFKDYLLLNGNAYLTARNYISRIERVLSVLKEEDFNEESLAGFLRELQKDNSASTVNGYIFALTAYLKYLKKDIRLPKVLKCIKKLPQSIDEPQLEKCIDVLSQVLHRDFIKFKALILFLFYSGIRIGEIDNLKRSHFDLETKTAKIFVSKTKEERIVIYTEKTKDAIKEYFDSDEEVENAFNINSNAVQQRFKHFKQYFPDMNFHAHIFRHSFAVNCLRKGVDLLTVSRLLGHRDTKTTERYLGLTTTQFQEIYRNKVDNIKENTK